MATTQTPKLPAAKESFARTVAQQIGLDVNVVRAWVLNEAGPVDNPLNIMDPKTHRPVRYGTPEAAAAATVKNLRTNRNYEPVILSQLRGPDAQIAALAASPWDACGYRGTLQDGSCATAKPGSALVGAYAALTGHAPGSGRPYAGAFPVPTVVAAALGGVVAGAGRRLAGPAVSAAGSTAGKLAAGATAAGVVSQAEGWLQDRALVALGYLVLTVGSLALLVLGLARLTGAGPALARRRSAAAEGLIEPATAEIPF